MASIHIEQCPDTMTEPLVQDTSITEARRVPLAQSPPKNPVRACYVCSRKKTRCDMVQPVCGLCQRTGVVCSFPVKRKAPVMRKPRAVSKTNKVNLTLERLVKLLEQRGLLPNPPPSEESERDVLHSEQQRRQPATESITETLTPSLTITPLLDPVPNLNHTEAHIHDGFPIPTMPVAPVNRNSAGIPYLPEQSSAHGPAGGSCESAIPVGYSTAMHLVNVFFDRIQPWLPLLHMPRFKDHSMQRLQHDRDALANISTEEQLLYYAMFSMAARFSGLSSHSGIAPTDRGQAYAKLAMEAYNDMRCAGSLPPTLVYLQGCILLAYYHYTSGLCATGWIIVGVCVRLAYELGLSEIDDDDNSEDLPPDLSWLELEEYRRAWWLVWELDSFGSILSERPFAVDRRRICVKLPISDEAWFASREVSSRILITRIEDCWKSLLGAENQDERAWFLISNFLTTSVTDRSLVKEAVTPEEKFMFEDAIKGLVDSLPPSFAFETHDSGFDHELAQKTNFIIGTHLMLALASLTVTSMMCGDNSKTPVVQRNLNETHMLQHITRLSTIVSKWKLEHIFTANPFFATSIAPVVGSCTSQLRAAPALTQYLEIACTIQAQMAENWKLAAKALRVLKLSLNSTEFEEGDFDLTKRHPYCGLHRKICRTLAPEEQDTDSTGPYTSEYNRPQSDQLLGDDLIFDTFADILTTDDHFVNITTPGSLFAIPAAWAR